MTAIAALFARAKDDATMNGTDRKAFKSELRAALRRRALGIPQPAQADVLLLWMDWLHRHDRVGARRLMAWAIGTRLTVLAFHERVCQDTIHKRIDASLDAMRREFSGRDLPG
jgi:hypothetical protein